MLPNFIIIGAPRAGTTWISKNIREHPEIFLPKIKELHFFDRDYEKGIEYYERFFEGSQRCKAIGEATPEYLYIKDVPALIKQHLPDVKLILSLRNPVDRVYSRYWNAKARFKQNRDLSFEEKIKEKPIFLEEGFYYDHILRYLEFFPKENFLFLLFDDLKTDPARFLNSIYEFLDVDTGFTPPLINQKVNAASVKGPLAKSSILSYVYKGLISLNAAKSARFVEKINEISVPEMDHKTKEWLVNDVYMEKNKQLAELIGKDLGNWNKLD
jgi:hypothetical protein